MKHNMKRLLLILLAVLTFASSSCGQNNAGTETDTTVQSTKSELSENSETAAETQPEEDENSRASISDSLPDDLDFGGKTVTVLHRGGDASTALEVCR